MFWFISILFIWLAQGQNYDQCTGHPNANPIVDDEPTLIRTTTNGKLYQVYGGGLISPPLSIAHLYGSPYDMGYAYGELLYDQIQNLLNGTFEYFYAEIDRYIFWLKPNEIDIVNEYGVDGILDYVYDLAKPYIPNRYTEELYGIADGATKNGAIGVTFQQLMRVTMIPEALKAGCSMVGAWDKAVDEASTLVQLRALDWITDGPFQEYPLVLVYHPSEEGHEFTTLGWSGFVGALTGYGNSDVAICEKVWYSYTGKDSREGKPFTMVLRDILQFAETKEDGIEQIEEAPRTCSIWVGVGDSKSNEMNVIQYSYENVTVYDDNGLVWTGHPTIEDVIYVDKHVQPSTDPCLGELLQDGYGNISATYLFQQVAARLQTGDTHAAVYDYANRYMYVSNVAVYEGANTPQLMAYDRSYVRLNVENLFNEKL